MKLLSKVIPKNSTLQIQLPVGKTLLLGGLALLLFMGIAEGVTRFYAAVNPGTRTPSYGLESYFFELKMRRLDEMVAKRGGVDIIFLGSSMVNRGMDPEIFEEEYQALTGKPVRSFNMGIPGIKSKDASLLAMILARRYKPNLIVYGTSMRDFDGQFEPKDILDNPWVRYKTGQWNLDGWLRDNFLAYRYFLVHRNWMKRDYYIQLEERDFWDKRLTSQGFSKSNVVDIQDDVAGNKDAVEFYKGYFLDPAYLVALGRMLELQSGGTKIIVAEMPVSLGFIQAYPHKWEDQNFFVEQVTRVAQEHGTQFLPTTGSIPIPEDGWFSPNHLNTTGAKAFTLWLAQQITKTSLTWTHGK